MTTLRDAAQQALDVLNDICSDSRAAEMPSSRQHWMHCAIDDLRAALAQQDEPVALTDERIDAIADLVVKGMPDGIRGFCKAWGWQQFARAILKDCAGHYADPQPAPAEQPTDDQIDQLVSERGTGGWQTRGDMARFARAVLALRPVAQPLTVAQIEAIAKPHAGSSWGIDRLAFTRAIERAHKIGGAS